MNNDTLFKERSTRCNEYIEQYSTCEWDFIGCESMVALGKSATINKFKQWCGSVQEGTTGFSNPL